MALNIMTLSIINTKHNDIQHQGTELNTFFKQRCTQHLVSLCCRDYYVFIAMLSVIMHYVIVVKCCGAFLYFC